MLIPTLRYVEPQPVARPPKQRCIICASCTKGNKAWCIKHISRTPYAQWITNRLQEFEEEAEAVKKAGNTRPIAETGILLQEIVRTLHYRGSKTVKGLAKDLSLELSVAEIYVRYLTKRKLAVRRLNKKKDDYFIDLTIVPRFESPIFSGE